MQERVFAGPACRQHHTDGTVLAWPGMAPGVPRRVLIDSDANNEIDDQYAIVRALIAPELSVEALTAAGYHDRENGAQLSYEEEVRLLDLMGLRDRIPVAIGSALPMVDKKTPRPSPAAELIVKCALARDENWGHSGQQLAAQFVPAILYARLLPPDVRVMTPWAGRLDAR